MTYASGVGSMPGGAVGEEQDNARAYAEATRIVLGEVDLPHVPELPEYALSSADLDGSIGVLDCVAIVTAHSGIDYAALAEKAQLVVDFRNATGKNGSANGRVWKL